MADAPCLLVEWTNPPVVLQFSGGVNPKGEYNAATAYSLGDSVSYNGSSYVAIQATTGNLPSDTTYWQVLAGKGDTGAAGANAYVYVAYASDAYGTDFTMTFNAALDYIAVKNTTTAIAIPQASDFTGLWKNYKGAKGDTGYSGWPIAAAGGTVDAITATYSPAVTPEDKIVVAVVAAGANTSTTPTFSPNGATAHTITMNGGQALAAGSIPAAGYVCILEYNLDNTRWEFVNPASSASAADGVLSVNKLLHVQDQKTAGTQGGTFTTGAWQTRDLNTVLLNNITGASLYNNAITLPAGTYYIEASAPAHFVDGHQTRIYQTSGSPVTLLTGTVETAVDPYGCGSQTRSFVSGLMTLGAQQIIELQHYCNVANPVYTTRCMGSSGNITTEVYSDIKIWKVG